jgi:hypothetical protein
MGFVGWTIAYLCVTFVLGVVLGTILRWGLK